MKKILFLLVLVAGMVSFTFANSPIKKDTIIYLGGIERLVVNYGDTVKNLSFGEKSDKFRRLQDIQDGKFVQYVSHGKIFWLENPQIGEDTTNANEIMVQILWGIVSRDPTLVAMTDDRTGGDMREPKDSSEKPSRWPLPLASGLVILACVVIARQKKWL